MITQKKDNIKPEHNVQIPMQVLLHKEIDTYSLKVFAYMKFRYQFFTMQGSTFHESNTTIAEATQMSRSKVIESINKLVELGFVSRQTRHGSGSEKGSQTNIYIVSDILIPNGVVVKQEKKVKYQQKPQQKEVEPNLFIPEPDWGACPF